MESLRICLRSLRGGRRQWIELALLLASGWLGTGLLLLVPWPTQIAVDCALGGKPLPRILGSLAGGEHPATTRLILLAGALTVAVMALQGLHAQAHWALEQLAGERRVLAARRRLYRHVQRVSLRYFGAKGLHPSLYALQSDVRSFQSLAIQGVLPLAQSLTSLALMLRISFGLDQSLTLVGLGVIPPLILLGRAHVRTSRARWAEVREAESAVHASIRETLTCLGTVQAFAREEREERRTAREQDRYLRRMGRAVIREAAYGSAVAASLALASGAAVVIGLRHVLEGSLSLGGFLVVTAYIAQLFRPFEAIGRQISAIQVALAGAQRVFAILDERPEIAEKPDARATEGVAGEIEFRGVSFAYGSAAGPTFKADFHIAPGMKVGIIGPSGAGKSTLLRLLGRFTDPERGRITLDGMDLRDYRLTDLRRLFAFVFQDPVLVTGTIAENIAYGKPDATDAEIRAAARLAGADRFVARLPQGYLTQVQEGGQSLSGGERQRIALARAYLSPASVLVLDEPSSAVDVATERSVTKGLDVARRGRTCLVVSHRSAVLKGCDVVLHVEDGRVRVIRAPALAPVIPLRG